MSLYSGNYKINDHLLSKLFAYFLSKKKVFGNFSRLNQQGQQSALSTQWANIAYTNIHYSFPEIYFGLRKIKSVIILEEILRVGTYVIMIK